MKFRSLQTRFLLAGGLLVLTTVAGGVWSAVMFARTSTLVGETLRASQETIDLTAKLANIDKATFDFWRTMEYNYQSIGNPFSSPTVVLSNVSNNALGYFGGYAAQYKSVKIPK